MERVCGVVDDVVERIKRQGTLTRVQDLATISAQRSCVGALE